MAVAWGNFGGQHGGFLVVAGVAQIVHSGGGALEQWWCLIQRWCWLDARRLRLARGVFGIGNIQRIHGGLRNSGGVSIPNRWWFPVGW